MRRLDHAAIFALIAGTMTPIFLITLSSESSSKAIALIWGIAAVGMAQVIFWINAPKWFAAILYVGAGWFGFPYLAAMRGMIGSSGEALVLGGGLIYTLGAVIYALKKPNPWPRVFGYHEIFHILVTIAALCHFILIKRLLEM